ncbi:hypothetical protein TDB9533_04171 [Thalassocella blandensis]|nr:hypothetical protein TDB9533_04171 [Thalassocella blandensis]
MGQTSLFEFTAEEKIPLDEVCELVYFPGWLQRDRADDIFSELLNCTPWQQPEIYVGGRQHKIPRLQAWYGDEGAVMAYSGKRFTPNVWTPLLQTLKLQAESAAGVQFNSVLVNQYRDGQDSVSWHADDERELGRNPVIGSLSLGASREFSLKPRSSGDSSAIEAQAGMGFEHGRRRTNGVKQVLHHGDFLLMCGETQHRWLHAVSKVRQSVGPRINLTFRNIIHKS